jgi:hypothetical protein
MGGGREQYKSNAKHGIEIFTVDRCLKFGKF